MSNVEARIGLAVIGELALATPSKEEVEAGVEPVVELRIPAGIPLPIGDGRAIVLPLTNLAIKFSKAEFAELLEAGQEVIEKLPDPKPKADILTASNMSQVIEEAEKMKRAMGGDLKA